MTITKPALLGAITLVGALAGALASGAAQAQVFKCVGSDGKTVYSQSPCPSGAKSAAIRQAVPAAAAVPPPASTPAAAGADAAKNAADAGKAGDAAKSGKAAAAKAGPKTTAEQEVEFKQRRLAEAEAAKKASEKSAEAQAKTDSCNSAKSSLASLQAGGRQQRFNAQGERYFLDDAQVAAEITRTQGIVNSSCN